MDIHHLAPGVQDYYMTLSRQCNYDDARIINALVMRCQAYELGLKMLAPLAQEPVSTRAGKAERGAV